MLKFKEIQLCPVDHKMDIIVSEDKNDIIKFTKKRYGWKPSKREQVNDLVYYIRTGKKCGLKQQTRIVLVLRKLDIGVIVHELIHVLWLLDEHFNIEMTTNSQEWQACMMEYLYKQVILDNYENRL